MGRLIISLFGLILILIGISGIETAFSWLRNNNLETDRLGTYGFIKFPKETMGPRLRKFLNIGRLVMLVLFSLLIVILGSILLLLNIY